MQTRSTRSPFHDQRGILACLAILLLVLAACGSGANAPQSGDVTLTFGWWGGDPVSNQLTLNWLHDFEADHPHIKIKPEILPWDNYWSKLQTTIPAGNAYDVVGLCSCQSAQYYSKDVFVDLSQLPDYARTAQVLVPEAVRIHNWNGKQEALPIGIEVSNIGYNQDLFKAAGVPYPSATTSMSFADFVAIGKKLLKKDGSGKVIQYPFHPGGWFSWEWLVYMEGGHPYDQAVHPQKVTMNNPEGIAGLTDYLSLYQNQLVPPISEQSNGAWGDGEDDSLTTNKVAMARFGIWSIPFYKQQHAHWGVFPMFHIKKSVILGSANALAIYKGSKHQSAAWEFLQWATQESAESKFLKFADVPANQSMQAHLTQYVNPSTFVPTMLQDLSYYQPSTESDNTQLGTTLNDIVTDMTRGKLTPAQAAAKMDHDGNAVLASS